MVPDTKAKRSQLQSVSSASGFLGYDVVRDVSSSPFWRSKNGDPCLDLCGRDSSIICKRGDSPQEAWRGRVIGKSLLFAQSPTANNSSCSGRQLDLDLPVTEHTEHMASVPFLP